MISYKKIGILFVAAGLTITGHYMAKTGQSRVTVDDVALIIGASYERGIPALIGEQSYPVGTVSNRAYRIDPRPSYAHMRDALVRLRQGLAEGGINTPFAISKDTEWIHHGGIVLSNDYTDASAPVSLAVAESPRGIPDSLGGRTCAAELIRFLGPVTPWGLREQDGHRTRWQAVTGLTNGVFAAESSIRLVGADILAAESAITNSQTVYLCPHLPAEILAGSYAVSRGTPGWSRYQGTRSQALALAEADVTETGRDTITSLDNLPAPTVTISAQELFDQDWSIMISRDSLLELEIRPLWPCRQAVEANLVGQIEVYVILSVSWSWESGDDVPRKYSTAWLDGHSNAQLGLPASLLRSPMPYLGLTTASRYESPITPEVYLSSRIGVVYNPRSWPLPSFKLDLSDFRLPTTFPGAHESGQLSATIRIWGIFGKAQFIFHHDLR